MRMGPDYYEMRLHTAGVFKTQDVIDEYRELFDEAEEWEERIDELEAEVADAVTERERKLQRIDELEDEARELRYRADEAEGKLEQLEADVVRLLDGKWSKTEAEEWLRKRNARMRVG